MVAVAFGGWCVHSVSHFQAAGTLDWILPLTDESPGLGFISVLGVVSERDPEGLLDLSGRPEA